MTLIYKIARSPEWQIACATGCYTGSKDDERDGFIHFSTSSQLGATYEKYFEGESGLHLFCVDANDVASDLKWEASRGGELFPHLYAPLPTDLILWDKPISDAEPPRL